uniref:Uncharacterized protein AlNc14C340G10784 n=1 Tax=Albugo laibachii Nc14 TaxID=890382 RepID=F0WX27_9STRA|nr:conserved hypothetical protein [Albugo laibachii Nc14]|eukprot:CCA26016.1 conserved hypothetical protein [Albugo laibachii Nc14]
MVRVLLLTAKPRRSSSRLATASRLRQPPNSERRVPVQVENPSPVSEVTEAIVTCTESLPKQTANERTALARQNRLQTLRARKAAKEHANSNATKKDNFNISLSPLSSNSNRKKRPIRKKSRRNPPQEDTPVTDDSSVEVPHVSARKKATIWARSVLASDSHRDKPLEIAIKKLKTTLSTPKEKTKPVQEDDVTQMSLRDLALSIPTGKCRQKHEETHPEVQDHDETDNFDHWGASHHRASTTNAESALMAPQVQIIDGKMVITQTLVQREAEPDEEITNVERRPVNTVRFKRWCKEETKQFYYCLSQMGPTFSMMEPLFPFRSRLELKRKFKYEEKIRPKLIEIALRASVAPIDGEIVETISELIKKASEKVMKKAIATHSKDDDKEVLSDDSEAVHNVSIVSQDQSEELESSFDFGS